MRSSLVKFTAAAALIGTLAVALATISKTRDGAGAFAARLGLGGASGTHSAPGYGDATSRGYRNGSARVYRESSGRDG